MGTKCKTATDVTACEKKLAELPSGVSRSCESYGCTSLRYTRGDEVGVVTNANQVRELLSFQSLDDAALLAHMSSYRVVCSENNAGTTATGYVLLARSGSTCGGNVSENRIEISREGTLTVSDGVVVVKGDGNCTIGRRPEGLRNGRECGAGLGPWLADIARLEAASVVAFERLAGELEAFGAPASLVAMARESAADEVRHARVTAKLARRHGGVVEAPCVDDVPVRRLFEIARENAVEGCVRETFGALVATYQREHAESADLRAAMRVIAVDETKHSALSWEIAAWVEPLLEEAERRAVAAARAEAAADLRRALHEEPHADVARLAGVPSAERALAMFDAAAEALWAA